jgi:acetyl esterase/lipase
LHGRLWLAHAPAPPTTLTFERYPETCGIYAGTFDDSDWFEIAPANAKHIFINAAGHDTLISQGINAFEEHAITNEGVPNQPTVFDQPRAARDWPKAS